MKIGDYVRIIQGYIGKIVNINDFREPSMKYGIEISCANDIVFLGDDDIIKSDKKAINLVEVGDIVKYAPKYNHYEKKQILYKFIKDGGDLNHLYYQIKNDKITLKGIITNIMIKNFESELK